MLNIEEVFSKVGLREDEHVVAINDEDKEMPKMVFHSPLGVVLKNYKATKIHLTISFSK